MEKSRVEVGEIERELGLPANFLLKLDKLDDWSFLVQGHALIETLMTECLLETMQPSPRRALGSIGPKNKIKFLRELNLLSKPAANFAECLAELRNICAHNAKMIGGSMEGYVERIQGGHRALASRGRLGLSALSKATPSEWAVLAKQKPKVFIWMNILWLAHGLYLGLVKAKERRRLQGVVNFADLAGSVFAKSGNELPPTLPLSRKATRRRKRRPTTRKQ